MTSDGRTRWRDIPGAQRVEQHFCRGAVEIFIEIVVDLQDWRVDASTQTLDLDERKETVRRAPADTDAELCFTRADHLLRPAQPARGRGASLQQIPSDR